jgi:hypothetical protein
MSASLDGSDQVVDEINHPAYSPGAAGARRRRERIEHKSLTAREGYIRYQDTVGAA